MLTDMDVYKWLDSIVIPSVSRESAKDELADADAERAVFCLANEAFSEGALTKAMLDKLIKEYPDGWMNEIFVDFRSRLEKPAAPSSGL